MRIEIVSQGFPGKMTTGYMGWSSVVFIEQQGRNILFDTGGTDLRVDLCPRLASLGVRPEDIDCLVVSHFHLDHVYNYDYFTRAEIVLHEAEIAYAKEGRDPWQPHHMLAPILESGRLRGAREGEILAPGVFTLHLPGHTPGCLGLVLEDPAIPTTLVAGDAIKTIAEMATGRAPMTTDARATLRSVRKAKAMAKRVIPGHDRVLRLEEDRVVAETAARRTIVIPPDVVDNGTARTLELTLEPTWLAYDAAVRETGAS